MHEYFKTFYFNRMLNYRVFFFSVSNPTDPVKKK